LIAITAFIPILQQAITTKQKLQREGETEERLKEDEAQKHKRRQGSRK
jgi:hypothetical protein